MSRSSLLLRPGLWVLEALTLGGKLLVLGALLLAQICAVSLGAGGQIGFEWVASIVLAAALLLAYLGACLYRSMRTGIRELGDAVDALCRGDLSQTRTVSGRDELAALRRGVERATRRISAMVATVRSEAQLVAMAGGRLSQQASEMSDRTEVQAANVEQTSATVAVLAESVTQNAEAVLEAGVLADEVRSTAETGSQTFQASVASMQGLEERARQMTDIIGVIDGIAFQTNVLALNAAVEAARAGEHGRGFAVVASEVRVLAQRSAQSAAAVKKLIDGSTSEIRDSVQRIRASTQILNSVVDGVRRVAATLHETSSASTQQSRGLKEIAEAVAHVDKLTQENAHMVEATAHWAQQLHEQSQQISSAVVSVRLRQGCADEAKAMVEKAVAYIRSHGKQAAVKAIHDPKGPFRDRDMFVMVLDRNNHFQAFGMDPGKAGKPAVAAPGVDIKDLTARTHIIAQAGGGWIDFRSMHPATGAVVEKLGYILPAVDDWVVSCSINRTDGIDDARVAPPKAAEASGKLRLATT
ncbi:MAG TPA: methyl-accepting chemotaxis protein [Burkholderiaceae bacterium]|nr:methyl-accepting chemotaxis protein [Burkholderiaceae bacterium]